MPSLDFWFELASTYSYPAAMRVESAAARAGVQVRWRPFLLGPIFFEQQGIAIHVAHFGSQFRFLFSHELAHADLFRYHLLSRGIYLWEGGTCFLSTAHGPTEIDVTLEAFDRAFAEVTG